MSEDRYYKVEIEGWFDSDVSELGLESLAREMMSGRGVCVNMDMTEHEEEEIPEGAKNFFGIKAK